VFFELSAVSLQAELPNQSNKVSCGLSPIDPKWKMIINRGLSLIALLLQVTLLRNGINTRYRRAANPGTLTRQETPSFARRYPKATRPHETCHLQRTLMARARY